MSDEPNDARPTSQAPTETDAAPNDKQPPAPGRTPGREEAQKLKDAPIADPPPPTSLKPR